MNLYSLIDGELKRMYEERDKLLEWALKLPSVNNGPFGEPKTNPDKDFLLGKYKAIDDKIKEMRTKMFDQFEHYDQKIQEKVAELALTEKG